jgi:hypothetical protein
LGSNSFAGQAKPDGHNVACSTGMNAAIMKFGINKEEVS